MQSGAAGIEQAIAVWRDMAILRRALEAWFAAFETDMVSRSPGHEPSSLSTSMPTAGPEKALFCYSSAIRLLNEDVSTLPQVVEYPDLAVAESLNYYVSASLTLPSHHSPGTIAA